MVAETTATASFIVEMEECEWNISALQVSFDSNSGLDDVDAIVHERCVRWRHARNNQVLEIL